jgi:nucleotide-binding universal stress UspA family protein
LVYVGVVPFLERWRNVPTPVGSDVHGRVVMPQVEPPRKAKRIDRQRLEMYANELQELGVEADVDLGFGEPALASLVHEHVPDLLILGSHGHGPVSDFVHGTTVERLRHLIDIPVLVVPSRPPS